MSRKGGHSEASREVPLSAAVLSAPLEAALGVSVGQEPSPVSLKECFREFFKEERIADYSCERCRKKGTVVKETRVRREEQGGRTSAFCCLCTSRPRSQERAPQAPCVRRCLTPPISSCSS